jgi:dTDP-4-amino-4,6-dideoxygalactose transaminase
MTKIPFNKPYFTGKETEYIQQAVEAGHISGDGIFTKKCHKYFEERYKFRKVLLTTSCTDALEMVAILIDIKPGDEVIMPSFTFVSTANAFVLRGAKIIFVDSRPDIPNMDEDQIEQLITRRTKAIVPVHYGGVACDMDKIMALAEKYDLYVIEDAAHAIDSYYNGKPLGSIGHFGAFSFHETKNIMSGEGGMLVINDEQFIERAEIIRDKGTNRSAFFRGEVVKYEWVDIGSSFLQSDITAAVLYAQLENLERIQKRRIEIWNTYFNELNTISGDTSVRLPIIPEYATNNANIFYVILNSIHQRNEVVERLKQNGINAVFHYQSLHKSAFYNNPNNSFILENADAYTDCLLRLPLYYELSPEQQEYIIKYLLSVFKLITVE